MKKPKSSLREGKADEAIQTISRAVLPRSFQSLAMMMRRRTVLFVFTLMILVLQVSPAIACQCVRAAEEYTQSAVDKAVFIGIVRTVNIEKIDEKTSIYYLEPIMAYKGAQDKVFPVYKVPVACWEKFPKISSVAERIILEYQGKYRLGNFCAQHLTDNTWKKLREQEKSAKLLKIEGECAKRGGTYTFEKFEGRCKGTLIDKITSWFRGN